MNLADVFTFLFVILGFVIVYVAYWLMSAGLFPGFTERAAERIARGPLKMLALGAVTLIPVIVMGFALSSKAKGGGVKIAALSLVVLPLLAALFGSAGLALRIGSGLKSGRDEQEPWRRVLRGGIVLALTFVLPFIGTFVVMPYAFLAGFGAFLACCWNRQPAVASAPAPTYAAPPAAAPDPALSSAS